MLKFLRGRANDRLLRLFACACIRLRFPTLLSDRPRKALEISEKFADGLASAEELGAACRFQGGYNFSPPYGAVYCTCQPQAYTAATSAQLMCVRLASNRGVPGTTCHISIVTEQRAQAALLRDIFGPTSCRPAPVPHSWRAWKDGTIRKMAQSIYDERAFDRLPILADALEEAGCTDAEILGHCRSGGEHVRGCWVVDMLLDKS